MQSLPSLNASFSLNPSKILDLHLPPGFDSGQAHIQFYKKKFIYKDSQLPSTSDFEGKHICLFMIIPVCADSGLSIISTIKIIYSLDLNR